MKKYINIKNFNEIDVKAFTMIGGSTKRDNESMIGFFGSGLKYSIAVLLKNNVEFMIYSGLNKINITTEPEEFRGQTFDRIYINGEKTSMTKQMGVDWKLWYCIREIYCNAIDEGKHEMQIIGENEILPEVGQTNFFIEFDERFEDFFKNIDMYFSFNRKDLMFSCGGDYPMKVYFGGQNTHLIYRKGVQCYMDKKMFNWQDERESLYHYDCEFCEINESRVITNRYDTMRKIGYNFARYGNVEVIKNLIDNMDGNFELEITWDFRDIFFNNNWLDAIGGRYLTPLLLAGHFVKGDREKHILLKSDLIKALHNFFKDKVKVSGFSDAYGRNCKVEFNEKQNVLLIECLDFLKKAGFEVNHPIKCCVFEDKNILGKAENKEILLSFDLFEQGKKEIIRTILEEAFHLESQCSDETRGFQNHLINKIVCMMEEKIKVYL